MRAHSVTYMPALTEVLFLLDKVTRWADVFTLEAYAAVDVATAHSALIAGARFAAEILAPTNAIGDEEGAQLIGGRVYLPAAIRAAFARFVADGWPGFDLPERYGGQGLPLVAQVAFAEMIDGANVAFGMLPIMLRAAAWLLREHGTPQLIEQVVPRLVSGEWAATICISEAQAGSDVGRITTLAQPHGECYALIGTKTWISYGDHDLTTQAVHMVLARTPEAPAGTRGLSLFLVPRLKFDTGAINGWSVTRLERKLGLHASPTCVLNFDGAIGYRIGPLHQGLRCLFTMVNLMRLEVSIQGLAIAEAAADKAMRYAGFRRQGGPLDAPPIPIIEHRDIRRLLLSMQARIRPLRALILEVALNLDLARHAPSAAAREAALEFAEFMLPVCKTCAAETAFNVSSDAVQVAGGFGYTREAGIEQHLRDSRIMAIYEGTSGIQAVDLMSRKLLKDGGARYRRFTARIRQDLAVQADSELPGVAAALKQLLSSLDEVTSGLLAAGVPNAAQIEGAASDYLQLVGLVACGWMWLRMLANNDASDAGKLRRTCGEFYMTYYAPLATVLCARIEYAPAVIERAAPGLFALDGLDP